MPQSNYTFRLANATDREAIVNFMNTHWNIRHPLVNLPDFFDYYYLAPNGKLNFALCEQAGSLAAIAGFVPANRTATADVWVSIWVADPAMRGAGLELMAEMPSLTGCRTLACNNIRPETRPFYEFLGYTTGRVGHFYRLANKSRYTVAKIKQVDIPPVGGNARLAPLPTADALAQSGFVPPQGANPAKDLWYISRRYYAYPRQQYTVMGIYLPGISTPQALLATRIVPVLGTHVLRIADYIGESTLLPQIGAAVDEWMQTVGAEYADWYCAGIAPELLYEAGFAQRLEGSENIIPNYLNPPLFENTEYYYFTSNPEGFVLNRADGDQDRPNIQT